MSGIIPKKSNGSATRYSIYNPLSVAKAVSTGIIANYWTKTETKHYQNTSRKTTMA